MRRLGSHRKGRPGTSHSPQNEAEIRSSEEVQSSGQQKLADEPKSRPGTSHSLENETGIQLREQEESGREKLAEDVESAMLLGRMALTNIVRAAAHRILKELPDTPEGVETGPLPEGTTRQLADLAYAFACLEGAQRGVLPTTAAPSKATTPPPPKTTPPPPPKSSWG